MDKISMLNGMKWKLMERFGVQGGQFLMQMILARILSPEHYGVLSLMMIFVLLANVFVQNGFNTSLIQEKDIEEDDYSSVFWISMGSSCVLYVFLYFAAPFLAQVYEMENIVLPFRVLALMVFPGALQSVQLAKVSRELNFRKVFTSNIGAIFISGAVGIIIACLGGGIWALVVQTLLNSVISSIVMWFTVEWHPRYVCNLTRIKMLFSFGWKILVSSVIDTLYQNVQSLVIGKKYDAGTLGYHNRGNQFPQFVITAINGALQSVTLPVMALKQENLREVKGVMRNTIIISAYIIFPIMAGLAAVAEPIVLLLLTDKWLPCVPYLQIYCFVYAFWPIHTCNLQAINALGRSDIFLKLEVIKKCIGVILLAFVIVCFDSPIAIALTGVFITVISFFVNIFPNKKLLNYSYFEQMKDIMPSAVLSIVMYVCVSCVADWCESILGTLVLQVSVGLIVYVGGSVVLKLKPFIKVVELVKNTREAI